MVPSTSHKVLLVRVLASVVQDRINLRMNESPAKSPINICALCPYHATRLTSRLFKQHGASDPLLLLCMPTVRCRGG